MANGIPDSWKESKLKPIAKNNGDILDSNDNTGESSRWVTYVWT